MKFHSQWHDLLTRLVRDSIKKHCLYLSYSSKGGEEGSMAEVEKHCRFYKELSIDEQQQLRTGLLFDRFFLIECETEEEVRRLYDLVDGDDTGGSVYALTVKPDGSFGTENT